MTEVENSIERDKFRVFIENKNSYIEHQMMFATILSFKRLLKLEIIFWRTQYFIRITVVTAGKQLMIIEIILLF